MNAVEIEEAISNLAAQPFDAVEFPFAVVASYKLAGINRTKLERIFHRIFAGA